MDPHQHVRLQYGTTTTTPQVIRALRQKASKKSGSGATTASATASAGTSPHSASPGASPTAGSPTSPRLDDMRSLSNGKRQNSGPTLTCRPVDAAGPGSDEHKAAVPTRAGDTKRQIAASQPLPVIKGKRVPPPAGQAPAAPTAAAAAPAVASALPPSMRNKVNARRAMSMGPTAHSDPVTKEFMQLLHSGEGLENSGVATSPSPPPAAPSTTARALPHVAEPIAARLGKEDIFKEDGSMDLAALKLHFQQEGRLTSDAALDIVQRATNLLGKEACLLELKAPMVVIGDIHGQYYDLIAMMDRFDVGDTPLLFLGDYVDRGYFGCEVVLYLFALKIAFPRRYTLLRGNHECREVTKMYNFLKECRWKYSVALYDAVMLAFDALPLAAVVTNQSGERFFCVHGGISPYVMTLDDVSQIDRFAEIPSDGPLCDLMWSDPASKAEGMSQDDYVELRWEQNAKRKISWTYGWGVLETFLQENNLQSIVRAHEVKQEGYEEEWFGHEGKRKYAPLITLFSAPNYCDMYRNKSCIMTIGAATGVTFDKLSWTDHPYCLPDFKNGVQFSLPYLITHLSGVVVGLLKVALADDAADETTKKNIDVQISKIEKWHQLSAKVRDERQAIFQEMRWLSESTSREELFKRVTEVDATIEMLSPFQQEAKKGAGPSRRFSSYF